MSLIQFITQLFRCHGTPRQVAFSVVLGIFFGLIPEIGWHWLIFVMFFLVFRLSFLFVLASGIFAKIVNELGLKQIAYHLGRHALEDYPSMTEFWSQFCSLPVISILDMDRYVVVGAWILSILLGTFAFFLVTFLGNKHAKRLEQWNEKFNKNKDFKGNKIIRGQASFCTFGLLMVVFFVLALLNNPITVSVMQNYMSSWLHTKVTIEDGSFNYFNGRILLRNVSIADPYDPSENICTVEFVELQCWPSTLLKNNLHFQRAVFSGASFYVRETSKHINVLRLLPIPKELIEEKGINDWIQQTKNSLKKNKVWKNQQEEKKFQIIGEYANKYSDAEDVVQALAQEHWSSLPELLKLSPNEIRLQAGRPTYMKQKLLNVSFEKIEIPRLHLHLENLKQNVLVNASLSCDNITLPFKEGTIHVALPDLHLNQLSFVYATTSPFVVTDGDVSANVRISAQQSDFKVHCETTLENLELKTIEARDKVFGIPSNEFAARIQQVSQIHFDTRGNWLEWEWKFSEEFLKKFPEWKTSQNNSK